MTVDDCAREVFEIISRWAYARSGESGSTQDTAIAAVTAVLARLRTPTEEMLAAGSEIIGREMAEACWLRMLDAATGGR